MRRFPSLAIPVVALVAAALSLAAAAPAAAPAPDFTRLIVKVGKKSAQATVGYRCVPDAKGTGSCVEAKYPQKTTGTVRLRAGGKFQLLLGARAADITWRAARIDASGKERVLRGGGMDVTGDAKRVTKTGKRWSITMPKTLSRSTDLIGFSVIYPNAFSSFEIGAKVVR